MSASSSQFNKSPVLTPARLVSTSNISGTYSNGISNSGVGATLTTTSSTLTIDSVLVNNNDRVLLQAQSSGEQNGIYVANTTGAFVVLTRSADYQDIEQIFPGQYVSITAGTVNAGALFSVIEPLPYALGLATLAFNAMITSGLGTAAGKGVSDNTKTTVASVAGSTVSGNILQANDTSGTVTEGPVAANQVLTSSIVTPDVSIDIVSFDVVCGQAALASGGSVTLYASSGSKQYKVRSLQLQSGGTNFSGGSGNRLGSVTDGTTVFSLIPAANMEALTNANWGAAALPNAASAPNNTSTVAGASLVFKYSGGSADYTAGSLTISGTLQRVA